MRGYLLIFLTLIGFFPIGAHEVEQHFMRLTLEDDHLTARLEMDAGYALPEMRSNEDDTRPTGEWFDALSAEEKQRIKVEGQKYLQEVLVLQVNGMPVSLEITFAQWGTEWTKYFQDRSDTFTRMVWNIHWDYGSQKGDLELFWHEGEDGPSLALATISNKRELPLVTVSQGEIYSLASIDGTEESEPVVVEHGFSFFNWLKQGFLHVIPAGLDHILFILGIFLLSPQLKPLLTQSLVFTLAHSITLGLTVAGKIPFNGNIIEPLIALSIAYVAIENLFLKELKPWRLGLIFALGLLHGMGFGSVMSELPVEPGALVVPIIGFNLGVEAAQITILLIALGVTVWWNEKKEYNYLRIAASLAIAATGLFWTVERIFF
ncbi:MAG: HupE/UreJ family protein [Roseibacillus sp.]